MLAATTGLILLVVAILSSFVFVVQRDFRFKNNYAAGQRMAILASNAHLFAQRYFYLDLNSGSMLGTALFNSDAIDTSLMPLPDQVSFHPLGGVQYSVSIHGWDSSPINTNGVIAADKAASAYMHVKIRPISGHIVRPTDRTAFFAGAASRGLNRPGIVGANISGTDLCDGSPMAVRWGPEESACLSDNYLTALGFTDVQDGDLIIPTWEVALANASSRALFRYRQPERPELSTMTANLNMQGQNIEGVLNTTTRELAVTNTADMSRMGMRHGHQANLNFATTQNSLNILTPDPMQPALQVSGATEFILTPSTQVSVAESIDIGDISNPTLSVDVEMPIGVAEVVGMGNLLTVEPHNPGDPLLVAAQASVSPLASLAVLSEPGSSSFLAITGTLNAQGGTILRPEPGTGVLDIFAGDFYTQATSTPVSLSFSGLPTSTPFNVGAVEQIGSGPNQFLGVPQLVIDIECSGTACPDFVTDNPEGGL